MGTKRFTITESEIDSIKKLYMTEESEGKEDRKFCHGGNVRSLDEIMASCGMNILVMIAFWIEWEKHKKENN